MLTGKDVYEATIFAESDIAGKWDKLSTFDKHVYEVAASVLNGSHIAPLQGLVRDLYRTVDEVDAWDKLTNEWAESLQKRFNELCGGQS